MIAASPCNALTRVSCSFANVRELFPRAVAAVVLETRWSDMCAAELQSNEPDCICHSVFLAGQTVASIFFPTSSGLHSVWEPRTERRPAVHRDDETCDSPVFVPSALKPSIREIWTHKRSCGCYVSSEF